MLTSAPLPGERLAVKSRRGPGKEGRVDFLAAEGGLAPRIREVDPQVLIQTREMSEKYQRNEEENTDR